MFGEVHEQKDREGGGGQERSVFHLHMDKQR